MIRTSSLCHELKRKYRKGVRKRNEKKKIRERRKGEGGRRAGICVRGQDEFKRRNAGKAQGHC